MSQDRLLSRREVLRGLGTTISLPLLPTLSTGLLAAERRPDVKPPVRMAFVFVPNGVHLPDWTPQRRGADYDLPYILEPLTDLRDDLLVLSGLTQDKGRANGDGAGDHARAAGAFLTGAQPFKTSGANIRLGISADQAAAQQIGAATRFPSLELGVEVGSNSGNCDSGYSCAYSNNISWSSPTTPTAKELDPRALFDRLFSDQADRQRAAKGREKRRRRRKSVLDFALSDARRVQRDLGGKDRQKLDEYFTSIRAIEKRIAKEIPPTKLDFTDVPEALPSTAGARLQYETHLKLMCDLLVLAFQSDLTRISTFMFARAASNRSYKELGVPDGHHSLSHHQGDPIKHEKIRRINRFHAEQFAYLLRKLRAIEEGDGCLLDNCMIVYGSGLSDGNRHNNEDLPILMAGAGGGSIDSGRHVVYPRETPMCNLFLSMFDRAGVKTDSFGDSTGRLPDLTA